MPLGNLAWDGTIAYIFTVIHMTNYFRRVKYIGPIPKTKFVNSSMWASCDFASHHIKMCQAHSQLYLQRANLIKTCI